MKRKILLSLLLLLALCIGGCGKKSEEQKSKVLKLQNFEAGYPGNYKKASAEHEVAQMNYTFEKDESHLLFFGDKVLATSTSAKNGAEALLEAAKEVTGDTVKEREVEIGSYKTYRLEYSQDMDGRTCTYVMYVVNAGMENLIVGEGLGNPSDVEEANKELETIIQNLKYIGPELPKEEYEIEGNYYKIKIPTSVYARHAEGELVEEKYIQNHVFTLPAETKTLNIRATSGDSQFQDLECKIQIGIKKNDDGKTPEELANDDLQTRKDKSETSKLSQMMGGEITEVQIGGKDAYLLEYDYLLQVGEKEENLHFRNYYVSVGEKTLSIIVTSDKKGSKLDQTFDQCLGGIEFKNE